MSCMTRIFHCIHDMSMSANGFNRTSSSSRDCSGANGISIDISFFAGFEDSEDDIDSMHVNLRLRDFE